MVCVELIYKMDLEQCTCSKEKYTPRHYDTNAFRVVEQEAFFVEVNRCSDLLVSIR